MKQEQIAIERSARMNHDPDFFVGNDLGERGG